MNDISPILSLTTTCISTFKMLKIVHLSEKIGRVFFYKIKKSQTAVNHFYYLLKGVIVFIH